MKYIYKTLSNDEHVESFLKFHWWFFMPTILWMLAVLFFTIAVLDIASESFDNLVFFLCAGILLLQSLNLFLKWVTYVTTEQVLTNKRVFFKEGLIRRDTEELKKNAIETISTKQSIIGRILRFGDIEFTGRGGISFKFIFVKNPTEVKRSFENSL